MELKVWVDGVVRVVCGLSEETSCQDVVVTLAQAIGQTGRYVLVQRLRDNERQLLANERLLETISKLGQHAGDIQFFLRRIGPNNVERPVLVKEAPGPKQPDSEYHKPKEPKKSLTFNLGPSSTPKKKLKDLKKLHGHSLEQKVLPLPSSSSSISKDDLLQEVIQQQARLQALEVQLEALEQELLIWEPKAAPESQPLDIKLELKLEKKLKDEMDHELAINQQLRELHHMVDSYDSRLQDLTAQSGELEQKIQQESIRHQSLPMQSKMEKSLGSAKVELHKQQMHGVELDTSVTEIEKALGQTEDLVQTKTQEMDELNKELRHCNLQQFILQTGTHVHPDLHEHPGHPEHMESAHCLPDRCGDGSCLPSRCTAKQLMGHPRNLLNPLISSLHPDGIYV